MLFFVIWNLLEIVEYREEGEGTGKRNESVNGWLFLFCLFCLEDGWMGFVHAMQSWTGDNAKMFPAEVVLGGGGAGGGGMRTQYKIRQAGREWKRSKKYDCEGKTAMFMVMSTPLLCLEA